MVRGARLRFQAFRIASGPRENCGLTTYGVNVGYFAYATRCVGISDAATLRKVEQLVESCQHCNPEGAEIPFNNILDRVTGSDPSVTDYVLEQPARCPTCRREILEKTLVER